jgi:uncharacterized membrane protein YcaP (DUF421 family)
LFGEEDWSFLLEVMLRSSIMFLITIVALRFIGKRGIMQGVFEIVTIITLGSAAGDPMFYKKVGLLPALMVFITIVIMYRIINFFVSKSKSLEYLIEGRHVRLIKDKRFAVENFKSRELSKDEIYSDLRMMGVTHLGQVEAAYIEASGRISVFFLPDIEVGHGLPVRPELYQQKRQHIQYPGIYACGYCGKTEHLQPSTKYSCKVCYRSEWVKALDEKRVK